MLKRMVVLISVFLVINIALYSQENILKAGDINQKIATYVKNIRSVPMSLTLDFYHEKYLDYPIIENLPDNMVTVEDPHSITRLGKDGPDKKGTLKCHFSQEYNLPFIKTTKKVKLIIGNNINCYRTEEFHPNETEPCLVEAFDGTNTKILNIAANQSNDKTKTKLGNIYDGPKYLYHRFHPILAWLRKDSLDDSTTMEKMPDGRLKLSKTNEDNSSQSAILSPADNFMIMEMKSESKDSISEITITQTTKAGDLTLPANYEEKNYRIVDQKKIPADIAIYSNITYKILSNDECMKACKFEFPEGTIMDKMKFPSTTPQSNRQIRHQ